jgi:hypothetical protein
LGKLPMLQRMTQTSEGVCSTVMRNGLSPKTLRRIFEKLLGTWKRARQSATTHSEGTFSQQILRADYRQSLPTIPDTANVVFGLASARSRVAIRLALSCPRESEFPLLTKMKNVNVRKLRCIFAGGSICSRLLSPYTRFIQEVRRITTTTTGFKQ